MRYRFLALTRFLAVTVVAVLVTAGCTESWTRPLENYSGEPKGISAPAESAGGSSWAAWLVDGQRLAVILYGSSTCPQTIAGLSITGEQELTATLDPALGGVCARDLVPHTTVFETPEGINPKLEVTMIFPDSVIMVYPVS